MNRNSFRRRRTCGVYGLIPHRPTTQLILLWRGRSLHWSRASWQHSMTLPAGERRGLNRQSTYFKVCPLKTMRILKHSRRRLKRARETAGTPSILRRLFLSSRRQNTVETEIIAERAQCVRQCAMGLTVYLRRGSTPRSRRFFGIIMSLSPPIGLAL